MSFSVFFVQFYNDVLDEWLNAAQLWSLPFALLPVLHFTSSKRLMGPFVNQGTLHVLGWTLCWGLLFINGYLIVQQFTGDGRVTGSPVYTTLIIVGCVCYFAALFKVVQDDLVGFARRIRACYKTGRSLARTFADGDDAGFLRSFADHDPGGGWGGEREGHGNGEGEGGREGDGGRGGDGEGGGGEYSEWRRRQRRRQRRQAGEGEVSGEEGEEEAPLIVANRGGINS